MTFTLWFMGRPAAGKSTLAKRVETYLREQGVRVENLDGDEIRENLHPDLGFTREDRKINNQRTAFVCELLNRNGIATVTGMITPFREAQKQARQIIEPDGTFVLIYVKCSVEEAARRDPKDLYQRAKEGKIENFTGISHPFEKPHDPDIIVDTETHTIDENVSHIISKVRDLSLIDDAMVNEYEFEITESEESEIKARLESLGYLGTSEDDDA